MKILAEATSIQIDHISSAAYAIVLMWSSAQPQSVTCLLHNETAKYQRGTVSHCGTKPTTSFLFKPVAILAIPLCLVVCFGWYIYDVEYWSESAIEFAEIWEKQLATVLGIRGLQIQAVIAVDRLIN